MTGTRVLPRRRMCVNRTNAFKRFEPRARPDGGGLLLTVTGQEGVGKTTLAVELAHRVKQHYDVCLHYSVDASLPERDVTAGQIAGFFLGRLGMSEVEAPVDDVERFLVLGELLEGRRALLLLDDVRDAAQVTTFLEHVSAETIILTSRNKMTALGALEFEPLELRKFDEEASGLLVREVIRDRPEVDDELVTRLHRWSGGLPLALSIMAARLRHPDVTAADLDMLFAEPPENDVAGARAVDSMFATLDVAQARDCAMLALIPGTHFDLATAATALDLDVLAARRVLHALRDAHLLQRPEDEQYAFHDMLRRFAIDRAMALLSVEERESVTRRVVEHRWRRLVALDKSASDRRPTPTSVRGWYDAIEPAFTTEDAVRAAFEELSREWRNLLSTADEARKLPNSDIGCFFPSGLWFFAFQTARNEELVELCDAVLAVAHEAPLRWQSLRDKAASCHALGRSALVDDCVRQAVALGYQPGMQSLHDWYGNELEKRGDLDGALAQFALSRAAIPEMDPTQRERAAALLDMHVGRVLTRLGRLGEARPLLTAAHDYFAERDSERANHARAQAWLGKASISAETADAMLSGALSVFLELDMTTAAREACEWLADVATLAECHEDAERYRQQAFELARSQSQRHKR